MSGWWLASYAALWVVVVVMVALQLGTLRELGMLRQGPHGRSRRREAVGVENGGPGLGTSLPELEVESVNGHGVIELARPAHGKATLIAFLTPVCEGCQLAVEPLNVAAAASGGFLRTLAVVSGPETASRTFLMLFPLAVPAILDPDHEIALAFAVTGSPFGLLYNEEGLLMVKGSIATDDQLASLIETGALVHAAPVLASS